jgi:hypothetical protein
MEGIYYRILRKYEKKGEYFIEFEFADDPEGFFMPVTIAGETGEDAEEGFNSFIGTNSQQIQ